MYYDISLVDFCDIVWQDLVNTIPINLILIEYDLNMPGFKKNVPIFLLNLSGA